MNLWTALRDWCSQHVRAFDIAFGLLITALAIVGIFAAEPTPTERDPDMWAVLLALAANLPLVWRRTHPLTVVGVIAAATFPFWALDYPTTFDPALALALYAATAHGTDRRRTWQVVGVTVVAATALALVGAVLPVDEDLPPAAVVGIAVLFTTSAVLGEVMYQRRQTIAVLEQRARALESDLENKAKLAALDERARIAREMHDVVAHGMSAVVVQAGAAQRLVETDPDRAREALDAIESIGRESLTEMRRMLGLLRDPDSGAELAPQPKISDFQALAHHACGLGVDTSMEVYGERRPVPPGIELTAYRVVQEALTNVIRHAGRPVTAEVGITFDDHTLTLEIVDDGLGAAAGPESPGTGHGLVGMRERVALYNGSMLADPRPGGGFRVRVVLPLDSAGQPVGDDSITGTSAARGTHP